jgi:hypothetical protein
MILTTAPAKLYGLCLVKNEADVIGQCLLYALDYCDKIIVLDNGSSDCTWDIVQELSHQHPDRIIAYQRLEAPFDDGLRAMVYNAFHQNLTERDWWLRLDADEFLNEDPRPAIALAEKEGADFIRAWQMGFLLTHADVAAWEAGRDNRQQPIEARRLCYRVDWREYRLFRNHPTLTWDAQRDPQWPQNLSKQRVCSKSLFNRHYRHRDPEQMAAKFGDRFGHHQFRHIQSTDWRSRVVSERGLPCYVAGKPVQFNPLFDFWLPRLRREILNRWQRLKRRFNAPKPAAPLPDSSL